MGGDESQSIASSSKRKVPTISTWCHMRCRAWDGYASISTDYKGLVTSAGQFVSIYRGKIQKNGEQIKNRQFLYINNQNRKEGEEEVFASASQMNPMREMLFLWMVSS